MPAIPDLLVEGASLVDDLGLDLCELLRLEDLGCLLDVLRGWVQVAQLGDLDELVVDLVGLILRRVVRWGLMQRKRR